MIRSLTLLALTAAALSAQETAPKNAATAPEEQPRTAARPALAANTDVRHFLYTLTELEGNKRVNSRTFDLTCREDRRCSMKTGSRVPFAQSVSGAASTTNFQYVDVGLQVNTYYRLRADGKLDFNSTVDVSNVAEQESKSAMPPIVRQTRNDIDTVLAPNVSTVLGTIEDLNSGHRYELSVVAKDH